MTHIGTTPYKFRIDIFMSYVDHVKSASDVCIVWERRGKVEATNVAKVKDNKAVFRQTLSMEATLFRKSCPNKQLASSASSQPEEIKFDEKKAKFILKKGSPDGKPIGKISLNLANYIKGTTSTAFADLKLSNGSLIVSKIQATMLYMGKRKNKSGSTAGSETYSEMTEANSMENDSIFGDDDTSLTDLENLTYSSCKTPTKASSSITPSSPLSSVSSALKEKRNSDSFRDEEPHSKSPFTTTRLPSGTSSTSRSKAPEYHKKEDDTIKPSPSLKNKLKTKIKEKKVAKKEKEREKEKKLAEDSPTRSSVSKMLKSSNSDIRPEIKELRYCIDSLKKENAKLQKSKQAAMEEIDALRSDLEACEKALEETKEGGFKSSSGIPDMPKSLMEKNRRIADLEAQNQSLLDELEENHEDAVKSASLQSGATQRVKSLMVQIEDLEVALKREPQYLDVVNELKVTKVSLALANMEKEQALFALQTLQQEFQRAVSQ